jgi:hypothetical protein
MRMRDPLAMLVAGVLMLGLVALLAVGGRAALDLPAAPPSVASTIERPVVPAPTAPEEDVADAAERARPLHIRIGTIGVDAPVVRVGLEPDGAMEIPDRVAEVGWYDPDELGVAPGTTGTAVLAGHVDSRTQGRGSLYHLRDLRVGETIEIDLTDGSTQRWRITAVTQYPKDVLPYEEVFVWSGPPRLAIITCGGEFDRTARSYTDNLIAYAELLDDTASSPGPGPSSPASPAA